MKFWEYQIRAEADFYKVFRVKDMMTDYDTSVLRRLEIVCQNVTFETLLEYSGLFVAHFLIHL